MKERIQALLGKGVTYADINFEIRQQGGTYTGVVQFMTGKTKAPTTIHMEQLRKAVGVLEAN